MSSISSDLVIQDNDDKGENVYRSGLKLGFESRTEYLNLPLLV